MAEDILINFIGKTDELQPVENVMETIIAQSGEVGQAWGKAATAMSNANKATTDSSTKLVKSIADMAAAAKNMDKSLVGGAYKDYLKQIQTQLGLTNKELANYINTAKAAAQKSIFDAQTQEEVNNITAAIEAMNEQLSLLGESEDKVETKTQSLKAQLRAMKNELGTLEEGTPEFTALYKKAGELDDRIKDLNKTISNTASDTRHIDGLINLMSGVAGGFAVAQGAAALFGSENEEMQKALQKVMGAMALLQGLQQIGDVIQKESAASLLLERLLRKNVTTAVEEQTAATEVQTATKETNIAATEGVALAEGEQAVATDAATVSQIALNTAMELNPIYAVLAGLLALTEAIAIFISLDRTAEQAQLKLNTALEESTKLLDIDLKTADDKAKIWIAIQKEKGANVIELSKTELNAGNERIKILNNQIASNEKLLANTKVKNKATLEDWKKLNDEQLKLQLQLSAEKTALEVKAEEFQKLKADEEYKSFVALQQAKVSATIAGTDAERNIQISTLRAIAAEREKNADFIALTEGEKAKQRADDDRQIQALQLANYQHYLKGKTSLAETQVAEAKLILIKNETDSIDSINKVTEAEIEAEKRKLKEAQSNPTLNKGEQAKLIADSNLAIAQLEQQQQLKILDIQKSGINAKLLLTQKGSSEEYQYKLDLINKEKEIELAQTEVSEEKKLEIKAKYQKQEEDALKAFNEAQLQNKISYDNAELDQFGITEQAKLIITLKRIEEQRDLEIVQADKNQAKIAEINAKYDKQIVDSKKAAYNAILADNLKVLDLANAQNKAYNERVLSQDKYTLAQKKAASREILNEENASLDLEYKNLLDQYSRELLTDKEYNDKKLEIENKRAAASISNEERITAATTKEIQKRTNAIAGVFSLFQKSLQATLGTDGFTVAVTGLQNFGNTVQDTLAKIKAGTMSTAEGMKLIASTATSAIADVTNQIFADQATARQQALDDTITTLENQKTAELNAKNLTEAQKADIDKKYKERERQAKLKAWMADKEAKEEEAIINGALAITKTFAELGWPGGIFMSILLAAATAAQVAKISNAQPPKFRHGKIDIQGPGTTTSDSIHARISKGESVIKAESTAKWKDALEAINNDKFESYLSANIGKFIFPSSPDLISSHNSQIDYDRLAIAVADKMKGVIPASNSTHVNIDKDGIKTLLVNEHTKTEIKNKYFSMT